MPDYDFRTLSDHDFEVLVRDLLQKELNITLESFTRGRDGGIDFRYVDDAETLVVQCKHYANYDQLLRTVKSQEVAKVQRLEPSRYVLAVSTALTPTRKKELRGLLAPYCHAESDIYGRDDLNNLLGLHPEIEQKNLKLWLTSEAVLSRVLNAGIWGDAELTMERIRRRASIYVPNPSYSRARHILEKSRHCIIAGIPGIGKTTLAEILLIDYVDRMGFQAVRIANDLAEIKDVKRVRERQIFYFDDFLGTTGLDKLDRNEDKRLLEFMEEVAHNQNWRFILTTREYILNAARIRYESFAFAKLVPCIIEIEDYTNPIKARILYNHIYFSDLRPLYKLELLSSRRHARIINHSNYNPRIIEHMTDVRNVERVPIEGFYKEFVANLDNPARVWDHAFRNQLSQGSQHLLLAMGSSPNETRVSDLRAAFNLFYQFRRQKLGFTAKGRDFEHALKELDGNFVKTKMIGQDNVIEFHNPSVMDFLENYLVEDNEAVLDLVESASYFDQLKRLWRGRRGSRLPGIKLRQGYFLQRLKACISSPDMEIARSANAAGEITGTSYLRNSFEERAAFIMGVADEIDCDPALEVVNDLLREAVQRIEADTADRRSLMRVLEKLGGSAKQANEVAILEAATRLYSEPANELEEYGPIGQFIRKFPSRMNEERIKEVRCEFEDYCAHYKPWGNDPQYLTYQADQMAKIGTDLEVEVDEFVEVLRQQAKERESEEPPEPDVEDFDESWRDKESEAESIDEMFDRLREEVENS